MKLVINPKEFVTTFINPLNEVNTDGRIAIFTDEDLIYSISANKSETIRLYMTHRPLSIEEPIDRFNVNINRLLRGLQCLSNDVANTVELNIDDNGSTCSFLSDTIKFNVRLLEDKMVNLPKFNVEIFKAFPIDFVVPIDKGVVANIKRALEFSSETGKVYMETEANKLYLHFGDKSNSETHTDNIKILVSNDAPEGIPNKIYDVDILRFILKVKTDFVFKLNKNGVMFIEITNSDSILRYITSPLLK